MRYKSVNVSTSTTLILSIPTALKESGDSHTTMSTSQGVETQTHRHPRRRMMLSTPSPLGSEAHSSPRLRKGETFHSPSRPPRSRDPLLHFPLLPRRSPTSPEALEAIATGQQRMANLLDNLENDMSRSETSDNDGPYSPAPRRSLRAAVKPSNSAELSDKDSERSQPVLRKEAPAKTRRVNCHDSDSGLGSSIRSVETAVSKQNKGMSSRHASDRLFALHPTTKRSAVTTGPLAQASAAFSTRKLSNSGRLAIEGRILFPLLKEEKFRPYHTLVRRAHERMEKDQIVCLRDLEKTLLMSAPVSLIILPASLTYEGPSLIG